MPPPIENWAEHVCAGDVLAVSRAITAIENHQPEAEELLRSVFPRTGKAYLTGVTGAPGTGKSTLVDRLAAHYRRRNEAVGVIAVDPTSPLHGRRDSWRSHSHASARERRGHVHSLDGDARISGRPCARHGGGGVAARCRGQRSGAHRDRRRGAGRSRHRAAWRIASWS